jgi:hypothetical protein
MTKGKLASALLMAGLLVIVLVYFGVNLAAYFMDPYTTTPAYEYTGENAVTVAGYVVRSEEPITASGGELVYFSRAEGERVSTGGTVALVYQTQQALSDATTIRTLNEQLEQLEYARTLASGSQTSVKLDEEVSSAILSFQSQLASGETVEATDEASALRSAVLRRSYAYAGTDELDASIASLESQIASLTATAAPYTTSITASKGGLFSSLVDGYESVLTPESLEDMTAADYRNLAPQTASGIGKMVYGSTWYFVTLMRESDTEKIAVGDSVTLRFQSGLDRDLTMTIDRIGDVDSGQRLVVLSCDKYLDLTTLLRHQNAQIIFASYTGIRVPRSAVRVLWETTTDEDGEPVYLEDGSEDRQQVIAVFCLWGTTAKLKPVEILWQEDDYLLVTPSETALSEYTSETSRESRRLRAGDEVITAAADLYDGKVIQ